MNRCVTRNDFLTIELFEEILSQMEELRQLMEREFDKRVVFNAVDLSAGMATIPLPSLVNALERNFDLLARGGYGAGQLKPTMEWFGELNDRRRLDFNDVNRWMENLRIMNEVVVGIKARLFAPRETLYCGCGRTRQKIRSVE